MANKYKIWFNCLRGDKLKEVKKLTLFLETSNTGNHIFELKSKKIIGWNGWLINETLEDYYINGLTLPYPSDNPYKYRVQINSFLLKCTSNCSNKNPWIYFGFEILILTKDIVPKSYAYKKNLKKVPIYNFPKCKDIKFPIKENINFYYYNKSKKNFELLNSCNFYLYCQEDQYCTWYKKGLMIAEGKEKICRPDPPENPPLSKYCSIWSFGRNNQGQLAIDSFEINSKSIPIQAAENSENWKFISAGFEFGAGIKTNGTLWTWGDNNRFQLGINKNLINNSGYALPIPVALLPFQSADKDTGWKEVSCGTNHAAAIKEDGTLWTWGFNFSGELGQNGVDYRTSRSSPVQTYAGGNNWKHVSCGDDITAAIKTNGTLWVWGRNLAGMLWAKGDNDSVIENPKEIITEGNDWESVCCGIDKIAAIKTDGSLWTWGLNYLSSYDGSPAIRHSGNDWKQISLGLTHSAGLKDDGTIWCWGNNGFGQFGNNSTALDNTFNFSPVQTIGTNWISVNCGATYTAGIKEDGTLWTWGRNLFGELGQNQTTGYNGYKCSSPVQTYAGGNNWIQVAINYKGYTSFAIKNEN